MKDHEIAKVVNELRDIATQYHATQQLRERIANVVVPLLKQPDHSGDGSDINQCDGCQSGAPINAHGNHQYRDGSLIGCTKVRYTVPQDSDERRDNFDVLIKQFATEYALDRTAAGGWIFENHNLFKFVYAALASNKAAAVAEPVYDTSAIKRIATQMGWTPPRDGPALQRYTECMEGESEPDPVERLRFFCSLAMSGQDWIDVEPFFDAITSHPAAAQPARAEVLTEDWARETMNRQHDLLVDVLGKLRSAQICHPNAVQHLIDEAIDLMVKP